MKPQNLRILRRFNNYTAEWYYELQCENIEVKWKWFKRNVVSEWVCVGYNFLGYSNWARGGEDKAKIWAEYTDYQFCSITRNRGDYCF